MNMPKLARLSVLCLILFLTALTAFAQPAPPPCSCDLCRGVSQRNCTLDGQTVTCAYFLAVALCPAGPTNSPADSLNRADGSFLTLKSEPMQASLSCMISGN